MSDIGRPDPDEILERIKSEESRKVRARLKVFFGMCAGVGKTYAMLQEAEAARRGGVDIVLGLVETHGRAETEALLGKLELLPLKELSYRGLPLRELDVDGILDRRPEIVVIDELAHSNAPGSRHKKRWQDVLEILDHGISVWTAVNVQHIESLSDVVEDISEVQIRERVPDSVLDRADEIRLIDIAPRDLVARLEEGRVYTGESSRVAVERFFKLRTLGALRELALRFSAGNAEQELRDYARTEGGLPPGSAPGGTIIVAVGPAPSSAFLIRWTRRTAYALRARWVALYVDTGEELSREDGERLEANLGLARKLGAETLLLQSKDVASTLIETAKARSASMIVVGRSGLSTSSLLPHRPTISERIAREAGPIDVSVVEDTRSPRRALGGARLRVLLRAPLGQYALAAALCAALTGLSSLVSGRLPYWGLSLLYLTAILAVSPFVSLGPIVAFSLLSAIAFNFFFIPPRFTIAIASPEDLLLFIMFFVAALAAGTMVARLRSNERLFRDRERRAAFLLSAADDLAECRSAGEAALKSAALMEEYFETEAVVYALDEGGSLLPHASGGKSEPDEKERAAAFFALSSLSICGAGTDSLPDSAFHYVPAASGGSSSGVLALRLPEGRAWRRSDDNLLLSLGRTFSLVVERENSELRSRHLALGLESDRLSTLFLDMVSHELRTPLTTITGSITALKDRAVGGDEAAREEMLDGALEAADRLNRLVEEILSMNMIESGALRLSLRFVDATDIAELAIREAGPALRGRRLRVVADSAARPANLDSGLVARLAANLLGNAALYSRPGGAIELELEEEGDLFSLAVRDEGPGIRAGEIASMFERFKRGKRTPTGGLGLGLAICKGIAEAHGGGIVAQSLPDGHFEVRATFPHSVRRR